MSDPKTDPKVRAPRGATREASADERLIKEISSPQNQLIREVARLLTKSKARRAEGLCVIEGLREVERAARSGVLIETLLYRPEVTSPDQVSAALRDAPPRPASARRLLEARCGESAFRKVAYRADVPNLVAVARRPDYDSLSTLEPDMSRGDHAAQGEITPLLLILEGIEKPGNLGAMLRTADALGVTGVILVDCDADPDHPNAIRNSLGAAFSLKIAAMSFERVTSLLRASEITPYQPRWIGPSWALPIQPSRLEKLAPRLRSCSAPPPARPGNGIAGVPCAELDHCVAPPSEGAGLPRGLFLLVRDGAWNSTFSDVVLASVPIWLSSFIILGGKRFGLP